MTGAKLDANGYGRIRRNTYAHRVAYEDAFGPISDGHQIHHLCGNRACVEPDHLVSMTIGQHRFFDRGKFSATCRRGHPRTRENIGPNRTCRACKALTDKALRG